MRRPPHYSFIHANITTLYPSSPSQFSPSPQLSRVDVPKRHAPKPLSHLASVHLCIVERPRSTDRMNPSFDVLFGCWIYEPPFRPQLALKNVFYTVYIVSCSWFAWERLIALSLPLYFLIYPSFSGIWELYMCPWPASPPGESSLAKNCAAAVNSHTMESRQSSVPMEMPHYHDAL